jgi:hypothetical protein
MRAQADDLEPPCTRGEVMRMIDPVALAEAAHDALDRFGELTAYAEFGDGWSSGRSSSATTTSDHGPVRERRVNVDF